MRRILREQVSDFNAPQGIDFTEFNDYNLCKTLHCLPSQLAMENAQKVNLFKSFMDEEGKAEKYIRANQKRTRR